MTRPETAGIIGVHNLKCLGRFYVVHVFWRRWFEGRVGPAFVKPIFNPSLEFIKKPDRGRKISRYTSTNRLLLSYIERGEKRGRFSRRRAAFNIRVVMIRVIMALGKVANEELYRSLFGGRFFLICRDCPD